MCGQQHKLEKVKTCRTLAGGLKQEMLSVLNDGLTEDGLDFTPKVKGRVGEWLSLRLSITHTLFRIPNTRFS